MNAKDGVCNMNNVSEIIFETCAMNKLYRNVGEKVSWDVYYIGMDCMDDLDVEADIMDPVKDIIIRDSVRKEVINER